MLTSSLLSDSPRSIRGMLILSVFFIVTVLFSSCLVTKSHEYFKTLTKDTTIKGFITNDFESKIQKKDVLAISISSLSREEDFKFNGAASITSGNIGVTSSALSYLVNEQGSINMHQVGAVEAAGLTRKQLQEKLQQQLAPYLKDPIVSVQYLNHKVTIMGEVAKPQILNMPEEQISVIDAIISAGDMTEKARRESVLVIREEGDQKRVKHLNLQDHSIFSSPWYYVKPNDILYVLPDEEWYIKEEKRKNLQNNVALAATGISLILVIINYIKK